MSVFGSSLWPFFKTCVALIGPGGISFEKEKWFHSSDSFTVSSCVVFAGIWHLTMDLIVVLTGNLYWWRFRFYHWVCTDIQSDIKLTVQKQDNVFPATCHTSLKQLLIEELKKEEETGSDSWEWFLKWLLSGAWPRVYQDSHRRVASETLSAEQHGHGKWFSRALVYILWYLYMIQFLPSSIRGKLYCTDFFFPSL